DRGFRQDPYSAAHLGDCDTSLGSVMPLGNPSTRHSQPLRAENRNNAHFIARQQPILVVFLQRPHAHRAAAAIARRPLGCRGSVGRERSVLVQKSLGPGGRSWRNPIAVALPSVAKGVIAPVLSIVCCSNVAATVFAAAACAFSEKRTEWTHRSRRGGWNFI